MTAIDADGSRIFCDGDNGAAHVLAHELCDQNRNADAYSMLGACLESHSGSGSDWVHLQYHMALCELELDDWNTAYRRFEQFVLPTAASSIDALTDAPDLLWWLQAKTPRNMELPWEHLHDTAVAALPNTRDPFVQMHNLLAICGAGGRDQQKASAELTRVCNRGGKIAMANWTPDGFIGRLLKTVGKYAPPPVGVEPTVNWGTKAFLNQPFRQCSNIVINNRWFVFRYESPQHWLDVFAGYYGPVLKALQSLDLATAKVLQQDNLSIIDSCNRATDGTMVVPSSYAEIVITK